MPFRVPSTDLTELEHSLDYWHQQHSQQNYGCRTHGEDEPQSKVRYNDTGSLEEVGNIYTYRRRQFMNDWLKSVCHLGHGYSQCLTDDVNFLHNNVTCKKESVSDCFNYKRISGSDRWHLSSESHFMCIISLITPSHYLADISFLFDILSTHIILMILRHRVFLLFCVEAFSPVVTGRYKLLPLALVLRVIV